MIQPIIALAQEPDRDRTARAPSNERWRMATALKSNRVSVRFGHLKSGHRSFYQDAPYAARSGRDIQLTIGIAGSTHPSPATT